MLTYDFLKSKFPKALDKFSKWYFDLKVSENDKDYFDFQMENEVFENRKLYDFFDNFTILCNVTSKILRKRDCVWIHFFDYEIKQVAEQNIVSKYEFETRNHAENYMFEKAFEILELRLNDRN